MANVRNIVAPNYPVAPATYNKKYQDQFTNVVRLYSNSVVNAVNAPKVHGSFYDTTTQANPVASAENLMKLNSTVMAYGTKIGSPTSKIFVAETGVYNIQFSAQFDKSGGGADSAYIWLKINGTAVPHSAGKVVVSGPSSETIAAWNYVNIFSANDYFEIAWSSPDTTMLLLAGAAAPPVPQIPSVIVTVSWVSNIYIPV
jgi:hypothetical protein